MRLLAVVALAAFTAVPAFATDTSSLAAFVQSCSGDSKGCHNITRGAILSARDAKYGCIPADVGVEEAADKLLDWLKGPANANPKYKNEDLSDLMWTGIDEIWPCKK